MAIGATVAVTVLVVAGAAVPRHPATALDHHCEDFQNCEYGDDAQATEAGYDAWAMYASVAGPGTRDTGPASCETFNSLTGAPIPGHIRVSTSGPFGDEASDFAGEDLSAGGYYIVHVMCVPDDEPNPGNPTFDEISFNVVQAAPPADLLEDALSQLAVGNPAVITNPGEGNPSLVNFDTYLMLDEASVAPASSTEEEGPLRVTVWANPALDGKVTWDTGEDTVTCYDNGYPEGSCSYSYKRSSVDREGTGPTGRPAYEITASVTYTGGYEVYLGGELVGGSGDLPDIERTSEPYYLEVEEAQALNTDSDG